jgi:putative Mg2+ transporter-C (MgtC) family protein
LGGAIGLQRQAAAKPAGFRTHLLVSAAAAAFTAMGAHLHDTRIPSYIVVGIGFLGAGAIVRNGGAPQGLTTAASIWVASAVGLLLGYANSFGLYAALLLTAITLGALALSDAHLMAFFHIPRKATVRVVCATTQTPLSAIVDQFRNAQIRFESIDVVSVTTQASEEVVETLYLVEVAPKRDLNALLREISALPGVRRVEATEPAIG